MSTQVVITANDKTYLVTGGYDSAAQLQAAIAAVKAGGSPITLSVELLFGTDDVATLEVTAANADTFAVTEQTPPGSNPGVN